ncbi:hypothetical protein [Bacillus sp. FJAT-50079]|uniref:hypothetical protein n=1 Tax=Bacillus sp. FJAT-50079 TaxID=2833577 RepID=UPI001BC9156E|nr:hypothetical protein [Bacillus sp. FJAT-50079]MBS4209355.1 hypothetical protein [Bacillus sp. FJAT-50079]
MTITIKEILNEGKIGVPEKCEDLYVTNDRFVAVIDGATNITGQLIQGKAPGRFAAEVVQHSIMNANADCTLEELVAEMNSNLLQLYEKYDLLHAIEEHAWMAPTACFICYSHYYREIWQIGDCQCLIDGQLYTNEKQIDEITANARALFLEAEIKSGKTIEELLEHDTGWEYIQTLVQLQYYLQNDENNQFGFEVINGFEVDFSRVKRIKVPKDARTIILTSDGYPTIKSTLAETENTLQQLLQADPLCFRQFKSTKGLQKGQLSFDDRTYIKFEI